MGIRETVSGSVGLRSRDGALEASLPAITAATLAIAVSEAALYLGERGLTLWGVDFASQGLSITLWGHLLTLLALTLAPVLSDADSNLTGAFALVPLFRLVNLGMPVFFPLTVYWFPLIYAPLIPAVYLFARGQEELDVNAGWRAAVLGLLPGVTIAVVLAEVEYSIIRPVALIPTWSVEQLAFITLVMVGFVGLVEELLFRGVLQRVLQARIGRWAGLALASAVFGLMHSGYGVPMEMVFAGVIGFVFGVVYDLTDSVVLISVIHGVLNVFLFAVIPMQGSLLPL